MKAAWYTRNGEARDVMMVGEQPTPLPKTGEVRVKLAMSGINPSDVKSRRSRPVPGELCIPHSDGSGVIDMVGPGVAAERVGQRVWTWNAQWQRPFGTCAEYVALPEEQAVVLPDSTSFEAGACLGIPALTAFRAVQLLGDIAGKTLLVIGAGSAVSQYVVQLAVMGGASVIGTVGSREKATLAKKAGVSETIDYKNESVLDRVKELTDGRGVDGLVDMDFSTTAPLLGQGLIARHGVVVSYGSNTMADIALPYRPLLFASVSLHLFLVYDLKPSDRAVAIARLTELLQHEQLMHTIGARFNLDEIAAAHEAVEGGKIMGNVVVTL
jgi:NADPH2:quinone reductase